MLYFYLPQPWNQPSVHGSLVPFSGKWCLEAKMWVLGVLTASEVLLLPGPLNAQT